MNESNTMARFEFNSIIFSIRYIHKRNVFKRFIKRIEYHTIMTSKYKFVLKCHILSLKIT